MDVDASRVRDVNRGLSRGHGGFEIALAPVIFALGGLWLDRMLGITPALTILFAVLALIGVFVKQIYVYRNEMDEHALARQSTLTVGANLR